MTRKWLPDNFGGPDGLFEGDYGRIGPGCGRFGSSAPLAVGRFGESSFR